MTTTIQLTEDQQTILHNLQHLQKTLPYHPIPQLYLSTSPPPPPPQHPSPSSFLSTPVSWIQPSPQSMTKQHIQLQTKLKQYKSKSTFIQSVGNLIHQYDINFKHLQKQRLDLIQTIKKIHKDTSQLLQKQKQYINLSNSLKQTLDYYTLLDKFQFNYTCQINTRQIFQHQLQPIISALTDAIQFFTTNSNYANSKKYLNGLIANKTKVISFTKSFFIKLLNKQYGYSIKNYKSQLLPHLDSFYPKSKPKYLLQFLSIFPQFYRILQIILQTSKQSSTQSQLNTLLKRENQIDQFLFNDRTISLLSYLQKNIIEVYEQIILKFISFYRLTFHQNFHKNFQPQPPPPPPENFQHYFHNIFVQTIYILTCQAAYLWYCLKPTSDIAKQYAHNTLLKIAQYYSIMLIKLAKSPSRNKNPFTICNEVQSVMLQYDKFIRNYTSGQYQTYVLGAIIDYVTQFGIQVLTSIFQKIALKLKNQLEIACQNKLPKFKQTANKATLMQDVKQFIQTLPNLKHCSSYAQKYLVTSLDTLIKSIKQVSTHIESRLECYAWNIQIFAVIQDHLSKLPYLLIKKQLKLDVGQTTRIIQKVRNINLTQNFLQYATDIFTVLRTGVPTLSQLTLDFNTFIKDYFIQLQQKFVKDMVFVHAKNIIQFLQTLKQSTPQQSTKLCQSTLLKNLQTSFHQSIQNYIIQSNTILIQRQKQFAISQHGKIILLKLLFDVKQTLLDIMSLFYIEATKYSTETQYFQNIKEIKIKINLLQQQNYIYIHQS